MPLVYKASDDMVRYAHVSLGQLTAYQYMQDLLHLDACHLKGEPGYSSVLGQVNSPLRWQEWDKRLSLYPDQRLRAYIVDGIRYGFCVGYNRDTICRSSRGIIGSALENPHITKTTYALRVQQGE